MNKTSKDIRYLNKDFSDIKTSLLNFVKVYYQNTFNDFDETDPGLMILELVSYIGDTLSFYLDNTLKEMLLQYAEEKNNVLSLAQSFGYRPTVTSPAITNLDVYQIVPSIGSGDSNEPDYRYALKIKQGMQVASNEDSTIKFQTLDDIDFSINTENDPLEISIYSLEFDEPAYYLLKKTVQVRNGTQKTFTYTFDSVERYKTINIPDTNIISIDSVFDSDGNAWYETPYLAQDTIFEQVANNEKNDPDLNQYSDETPYLMKLKYVPRRFITRYKPDNSLNIQFGSGINIDQDEYITPNTNNVALTTPTGVSKLNDSWNISNFLYSSAYGLVPNNTTLTFTYSVGGGLSTNVIPNVLQKLDLIEYYDEDNTLDPIVVNTVKKSLAVNNIDAAKGGKTSESIEEIRQNAMAYFTAQSRTVTKEDYILRCYNMPSKYGSISKAYIAQDDNVAENPFTLNLYVLSYNVNKQLTPSNLAIKENLKTYLSKFRMLTDSIYIRDAFIINIKVVFEITVLGNFIDREVLLNCISKLKEYFDIKNWQINQPIIKADVIRTLADVDGVQSVIKVDFINMFDEDEGYINNIYDLNAATKNNIVYPSLDPCIFEVRYPNKDIIGRVINY